MTFISYAQNFEDVMLWRALKSVGKGFYIDVGANDPREHSITKSFYDCGWRGINIEPADAFFRRLQQERPEDINLRVVAGPTAGRVVFYDIANTGLSTTRPDIADRHRLAGHDVAETRVDAQSLAEIAAAHSSGDVHFLKIDVEGGTRGVIEGIDFESLRPWIILVEATLPMSQIDQYEDWEHLIFAGGYDFVYADGLNRFYLAKQHGSLAIHFKYPPNVFDDFVVVSCRDATITAERATERAQVAEGKTEALINAFAAERELLSTSLVSQAERTRAAEERAHSAEVARASQQRALAEQTERTRAAEERAESTEVARAFQQRAFAEQAERTRAAEERAQNTEVVRATQQKAFAEQVDRTRSAEERAHHHLLRVREHAQREREADVFGAAVSARLREREEQLRQVYESRSWRITAPLRMISDIVRARRRPGPPAPVSPKGRPSRPTVFVECTHTYESDLNTGIQRVVRNILRNAPAVASEYGYDVVPVILDGGRFVFADAGRVLADKQRQQHSAVGGNSPTPPIQLPRTLGEQIASPLGSGWSFTRRVLSVLLPFKAARAFVNAPFSQPGLSRSLVIPFRLLSCVLFPPALSRSLVIPLRPLRRALRRPAPIAAPVVRSLDDYEWCDGSLLLLLDSSWTILGWSAVAQFRQRGGGVVGVIYDLIPITHSATCVPELVVAFTDWVRDHLYYSNAFVCISRSVADQLLGFLRSDNETSALAEQIPIGHFHLGSQLDFIDPNEEVREKVKNVFGGGRQIFLMVGSIEPRKNHAFVVQAFEEFWRRGGSGVLVIIGRQGWKTEALLRHIDEHEQLGRQLFIFRDATDAELDHAYRSASALVIASEIEGFGLPVVEAFQRGLPVLCSDIPVFREIADRKATFFGLEAPMNLTVVLEEFCRMASLAMPRQRTQYGWIDWRQSTEQLFAAIMCLARNDEDIQTMAAE